MALSLQELLELSNKYGVTRIKAETADAGAVDLEKVIIVSEEPKAPAEPQKVGPDGLTDDMRAELMGRP